MRTVCSTLKLREEHTLFPVLKKRLCISLCLQKVFLSVTQMLKLRGSRVSRGCYTRFQCYVHSGYLSTSFDNHLSTSSFDVLIKMSQSQPMHADVCFMSLLCKWATSLNGYVSGLWLVDFDPSCLLSMSKDGWRKISAMHVTLKAGINHIVLSVGEKKYLYWLIPDNLIKLESP